MHAFARLAFAAVLSGVLAPALTLVLAPAANASVGVGIQVNAVRLNGSAHPGGSYSLPPVYVKNTGSVAETLTVKVEQLHPGSGQPVPTSWVRSSWTASTPVPAGASASIPLRLAPAGDAKPGSYASDIVVTGAATTAGAGIKFGAAAATGLEFHITPAPGGRPAWKLWTLVALITIVVLVVVYRLVYRRLGLRIRIEREGGRRGP